MCERRLQNARSYSCGWITNGWSVGMPLLKEAPLRCALANYSTSRRRGVNLIFLILMQTNIMAPVVLSFDAFLALEKRSKMFTPIWGPSFAEVAKRNSQPVDGLSAIPKERIRRIRKPRPAPKPYVPPLQRPWYKAFCDRGTGDWVVPRRHAHPRRHRALEKFQELWYKVHHIKKEVEKEVIPPYVPFPARPTSRKQKKVRQVRKPDVKGGAAPRYEEPWEVVRRPDLAKKIRQVILSFRQRSDPLIFAKTVSQASPCRVEMDNETPIVEVSKQSNVVIQEATTPDVVHEEDLGQRLRKFCATDVSDYSLDLSRWTEIHRFKWDMNQSDVIERLILPYQAVFKEVDGVRQFRDTVLATPFSLRQFARMDMRVKALVNVTPFAIGQLQLSWFYGHDKDDNFADRENKASISFNNHCIIDASIANTAELLIPYKNVRPYMNIRVRDCMDEPLNLGMLMISVLNKLKIPDGSSKYCEVSVQICFENAELMGMVGRDLPIVSKTEMLPMMAMMAASRMVNQLLPDRNRDKLPNPNSPMAVIPIASSNLSSGTNYVEPVVSMRLNPLSQTPFPEGVDDPFTIEFLKRQWGYIRTYKIESSSISNTLVACFDGAPTSSIKDFYYAAKKDQDPIVYLPPVSILSNLFGMWRGSLEYRFDFVATKFHECRLYICWVPNYLGTVNFEQAKSFAGTYFDLKEGNRSVEVCVPYIGDRPFWPRRYTSGVTKDEYPAPSKVCVFIVNQLVYTNAVSPFIEMNLYIRGGEDFELAVPCQPSIGLAFVPDRPGPSNEAKAEIGYYPYYVGSWRFGREAPILRYSPVSDHVAQFSNLYVTRYYKCKDSEFAKKVTFFVVIDGKEVQKNMSEYVGVVVDARDGYGAKYMALVPEEEAKKAENHYVKYQETPGRWVWRPTSFNLQAAIPVGTTKNNPYSPPGQNPYWESFSVKAPANPPKLTVESPVPNTMVKFESGSSGECSIIQFGESFLDCKDICRRYQLYHSSRIPYTLSNQFMDVAIRFPVMPQGLRLQPADESIDRLARDGTIPILLSAYRFYRGSIRMKIVMVTEKPFSYMVQIKPDRLIETDDIRRGGSTDLDATYNFGYASAIQSTSVNPILTIEIPFYQPGTMGFLQRPSEFVFTRNNLRSHFSLGECVIMTSAPKDSKACVYIYYSLGDDFSPICYQGFPPVIFLTDTDSSKKKSQFKTEMAEEEVEPPMLCNTTSVFQKIYPNRIYNSACSTIIDHFQNKIASKTEYYLSNNTKNIKLSPELKESLGMILKDLIKSKEFINALDIRTELYRALDNLVIGVICAIVTGDPTCIAINFLYTILNAFGIAMIPNALLVLGLTKLVRFLVAQRTSDLQTEAPDDTFDNISSVLTGIFSIMTLAAGVHYSADKTISQMAKELYEAITKFARGPRGLFEFFKHLMKCITILFEKIRVFVFGIQPTHQIIYEQEDILEKWTSEVNDLLRPETRSKCVSDSQIASRVEMAQSYADYLAVELNRAGVKNVPPLFTSMRRDLSDLAHYVHNVAKVDVIRQEPVCIWVCGEPGTGKTYLKDQLCTHLCNQVGLDSSKKFTYTPMMNYMTGARDCQIFVFDDIHVISGNACEQETAVFMGLMTDARFSPEQAHLEDKGISLAPKIVYVNANFAIPNTTIIQQNAAFCRRRDIVLDVRFSPEFRRSEFRNVSEIGAQEWIVSRRTPENQYPHIHFAFLDPLDGTLQTPYSSFEEILPILNTRFVIKYTQKQENQQTKLTFEAFGQNHRNVHLPLQEYLDKMRTKFVGSDESPIQHIEKSWFDSVYHYTTSGVKNVTTMTRDYLQNIFGLPGENAHLKTEMPDPVDVEEVNPAVREMCVAAQQELANNRPPPPNPNNDQGGPSLREIEFEEGCPSGGSSIDNLDDFFALCPHTPTNVIRIPPHKWPYIKKCCESCNITTKKFYLKMSSLTPSVYAMECLEQLRQKHGPSLVDTHYDYLELRRALRTEIRKPKEEGQSWFCTIFSIFSGLTIALGSGYLMYLTASRIVKPAAKTLIDKGKWVIVCPFEYIKSQASSMAAYFKAGSREQQAEHIANKKDCEFCAEVAHSGDNVNVKPLHKSGVAKKIPVSEMQTEICTDVCNLIERNISYIALNGNDKDSGLPVRDFVMRVFGVAENTIILPRHYIGKIKRTINRELTFINGDATCVKPFQLNECELIDLSESEYLLLKLPRRFPQFKNVVKHIMSQKASSYIPSTGMVLEKKIGDPAVVFNLDLELVRNFSYTDQDIPFSIPDAIQYRWHRPGRCMSPILGVFKGTLKIIGFHIAGGQGIGAAEPIVVETLSCIDFKLSTTPLPDKYISDTNEAKVILTTELYSEGVAHKNYTHRPAERTRIIPSVIHGYREPTTFPGPLTPKDVNYEFSPLIEGVIKHGIPPLGFPKDLVDRAIQDLEEQYQSSCLPRSITVGVNSLQVAVCGIPGDECYPPMELSTSEGFPYVFERPPGCSSKRYQFEFSDETNSELISIDEKVLEQMSQKLEMRKQGIIPPTVFIDCPKDARIKREKLRIPGKVRIFSISPTDYTIQFRQYFFDLLAAQRANSFNLENALGINVHSYEWTALTYKICSKGPHLLCGDYSNFGPSLDPEVVFQIGEIWCKWFQWNGDQDEENYIVRKCMIEEMRFAIHQVLNVFYRASCGSPSGAPCTVNLNNDTNKIYIRVAWLKCWEDTPIMCNFVAFKNHCQLFVYGDDLILNVSSKAITRFNNQYLQHFFAKYGIKYTDETKSDTVRPWCTLMEASFLKCKFRKHHSRTNIILAELDPESIYECANWCHNIQDIYEASKLTSEAALMLSFGNGIEFFNNFRKTLIKAWSKTKYPIKLYTYADMEQMRFGWIDDKAISIVSAINKEREFRAQQKKFSMNEDIMPIIL